MADLSITMHGDGSGAADAMKHVGHEASALHEILTGALKGALGNTVTTFGALETAAEKAAEMVKEFFKESIEDYIKAEKATNQLRAAAGALTGAFEEQAEAMSRTLNVRVRDIEHMQMLLLRYGAAPAQIEETTKAVLNFAAATGQDANSALMMMIRGVEHGTGSLGRMGVQFKATGDFTKDLTSATEALNDKFGGAAETDAHGLGGRTQGVALAMEGLRENVGKFFDDIDKRIGLLSTMTRAIQHLADAVKTLNQEGGWGGAFHALGLKTKYEEDHPNGTQGGAAPGIHLGKPGEVTFGSSEEGLGDEPLFKNTEKAGKAVAFQKSMLQREADYQRQHRALLIANFEAERKDEEEHDDDILKAKRELNKLEMTEQQDAIKKAEESSNEATKDMLKQMKEEQDDIAKLNDVTISRLNAQKQMWENSGMQLGQAFSTALENAMEGGTQSAEDIALDLTQSILTIAGGIIGSIAGEGDPYASQAGSMLGHLAGAGIKSGVKASHKHHDGDWIGVERYHSGGWPLGGDERAAILQTGERVLSRREVGAMGGPGAVDAMARGGGAGLHVHVSAIDTRSTREFFENDGGRGFYNALRTGRGPLTPLFSSGR